MKNNEEHVTLTHACTLLGITRTTLYRWIEQNIIEKIYIGMSPRIRISEIERILNK